MFLAIGNIGSLNGVQLKPHLKFTDFNFKDRTTPIYYSYMHMKLDLDLKMTLTS